MAAKDEEHGEGSGNQVDGSASTPSAPKKKFNWADEDETVETVKSNETEHHLNEDELAAKFKSISMNVSDLHTGELMIKLAGSTNLLASDDPKVEEFKVKSFTQLNIHPVLKKAVTETKGWESMSLIQQVGIPLILKDPPVHFIGQAQAGTGKTGTFVLAALGRIINAKMTQGEIDSRQPKLSEPQAIILGTTQELVTQIASEVNSLGEFAKIKSRRVMSARGADGSQIDAPWALKSGEDFMEDVIVGTVGMVKNWLKNSQGRRPRKPCINAASVKVLILDEADQMLSIPPYGFGDEVVEIRNMVLSKSPSCQLLLFSATFSDEAKRLADEFVQVTGSRMGYNEVTLQKKDVTLDKVVNFFVLVGNPPEHKSPGEIIEEIYNQKFQAILEIWSALSSFSLGQTVIFVNTKRRAQQLGMFLESQGVNVGMIHGDMSKDERERVFAEFKAGTRIVLVATNILSRGIDNPNVTLVINVDLPEKIAPRLNGAPEMNQGGDPDPETFVHRIGRSGRWTKKGASVSLISTSPFVSDLRIMKDIEQQLFMNDQVNRPLIQVAHPTLLGESIAKHLGDIH